MPWPDSVYQPPAPGGRIPATRHSFCSIWWVPDWSPRETNDASRCAIRCRAATGSVMPRSEEHTSELQSLAYLVCRLLLEKKNIAILARYPSVAPQDRSRFFGSVLSFTL